MGNHYAAFGLHLESEIELPELAAANPAGEPDVCIRLAGAPLDEGSPRGLSQVDGATYLGVRDVARYRICDGRDIAVDPAPGASMRDVRLFLLGSVLGAVCHQRGLLPLHASAIVAQGRVVAFAGVSGVGKSTLTAHFQARGYEILCDDVCVVSFDAAQRPLAWPGLPRIKLWSDALDRFGLGRDGLERTQDEVDKFHLPFPIRARRDPAPLEAVYILSDAVTAEPPEVTPLAGVSAAEAVLANVYRGQYLRPMGLAAQAFRSIVGVAAHAGVFAAPRRRGFDAFEEEAARLERHFTDRLAIAVRTGVAAVDRDSFDAGRFA